MARMMTSWQSKAHGLFGLVALEIWGRIYFMNQSVDEVSSLIQRCEKLASR